MWISADQAPFVTWISSSYGNISSAQILQQLQEFWSQPPLFLPTNRSIAFDLIFNPDLGAVGVDQWFHRIFSCTASPLCTLGLKDHFPASPIGRSTLSLARKRLNCTAGNCSDTVHPENSLNASGLSSVAPERARDNNAMPHCRAWMILCHHQFRAYHTPH